ncbi:phosphotransferase [Ramlibacter terrae]|uniref:Phosphotransferase n=1 Tax=Ramlibacter terrae TaxID=2732511 RepID=A0ABX6P8S8_9BURK|nr:phosphotransferase [Ramlibacter terrae]
MENTNYFVTAEDLVGQREYVLTLFERLTAEQLPFYLHLMKHRRSAASPCPTRRATPAATSCTRSAASRPRWSTSCPATANWRRRRSIAPRWAPCSRACTSPGATTTARNPTCAACPGGTKPCRSCCPSWRRPGPALLRAELAFQNHVAAGSAYAALPRGPVHADLFRDNVMFEDGRLTGFFDFYFAGVDTGCSTSPSA